MKRILALIGSPNQERSNTRRMVEDFIETEKTTALGGGNVMTCYAYR